MIRVYLNRFASLFSIRSEKSLERAIARMVENQEAPFWYSRIRHGVRSFFVENMNYSILDSLLDKLELVVPKTSFQKNDCENSKQVLRMIYEMPFDSLEGKTMLKPAAKSIPFYGI